MQVGVKGCGRVCERGVKGGSPGSREGASMSLQ